MNRLSRMFVGLTLALLSGQSVASDLVEFSTSMDFAEFEVVVGYLRESDAALAEEISREISDFKAREAAGGTRKRSLVTSPGYIVLEREDEDALSVAVFSSARVHSEIEAAYERALSELGI